MCGDSRDGGDVAALFAGSGADMLLTDPPYGVSYADKNEMLNQYEKGTRIQRPIANDDLDDYERFFGEFLDLVPLRDTNTAYIFMSGRELHPLVLAMQGAGYYASQVLVWAKNNHVLGRQDYSPKHEFIVYGWRGRHRFYGPFRTSVLEYDRPRQSDLHPTMKPVELLKQLIRDGSPPQALVYDPFLGSGSTLIAAEATGRRCYGMELEPVYAWTAVRRWSEFTGVEPERVGP
jgi:DNA modification methylase